MRTFIFHSARFDYTPYVQQHNNRIVENIAPPIGFGLYASTEQDFYPDENVQKWDSGITGRMTDGNNVSCYTVEHQGDRIIPVRLVYHRAIISSYNPENLIVKCDVLKKYTFLPGQSYFQIVAPDLAPFKVKQVQFLEDLFYHH